MGVVERTYSLIGLWPLNFSGARARGCRESEGLGEGRKIGLVRDSANTSRDIEGFRVGQDIHGDMG